MNNPLNNSLRCYWCSKPSVFTVEIRPNEPNIHWSQKLELICRECFYKKDMNEDATSTKS